MTQNVNKAVKDHKISLPPTKDGIMKLFKALNMHCTEVMAYEALIYCRGKNMEQAPADDFNFDRMIAFMTVKQKTVAPADNPRVAL